MVESRRIGQNYFNLFRAIENLSKKIEFGTAEKFLPGSAANAFIS